VKKLKFEIVAIQSGADWYVVLSDANGSVLFGERKTKAGAVRLAENLKLALSQAAIVVMPEES